MTKYPFPCLLFMLFILTPLSSFSMPPNSDEIIDRESLQSFIWRQGESIANVAVAAFHFFNPRSSEEIQEENRKRLRKTPGGTRQARTRNFDKNAIRMRYSHSPEGKNQIREENRARRKLHAACSEKGCQGCH